MLTYANTQTLFAYFHAAQTNGPIQSCGEEDPIQSNNGEGKEGGSEREEEVTDENEENSVPKKEKGPSIPQSYGIQSCFRNKRYPNIH